VVGGFIALMIVGMLLPSETPEQEMERVKAACEREFGVGTEAEASCELHIVVKKVERMEQDKMDRAERAAR